MKKKNTRESKYVSETVFNNAMLKIDNRFDVVENRLDAKIDGVEKRLDAKIDGVEKRLDGKVNGVISALVKTQQDVEIIKSTMATKADIQMIVDKIDDFVGKHRVTDMEQKVQSLQIKELKDISSQHEKRISQLESHP